MKTKLLIVSLSLCFFMVGFLTSRSVYGNTDMPYFKLLLYTMFGLYFLYQYRTEIKKP